MLLAESGDDIVALPDKVQGQADHVGVINRDGITLRAPELFDQCDEFNPLRSRIEHVTPDLLLLGTGCQQSDELLVERHQRSGFDRFLGKRVVLLGLYNGQRLDAEPASDIVTYSRALDERTPASTFVRALLLRGRVRGAVLIGDTGLEEAFENLILDGLDVGGVGPALLDPDVELDHVFD